ncbi:hypothetical protein F5B19DRAFT_449052 [Rostrohypoxylon terebratum]|nr:hypothetical protein F5B19DRAFT_449052 [Rostrohypoxylon terebratum]
MPPPIPVPSKAALHALKGIAFGTTCALGVILEDQRRRIDLLSTAVSNAKKIKAAKSYHGVSAATIPHEDTNPSEISEIDASHLYQGDQPQSHHRPKRYRDFTSAEEDSLPWNPPQPPAPSTETEIPDIPIDSQNTLGPLSSQPSAQPRIPQAKLTVPPINIHGFPQTNRPMVNNVLSKEKLITTIHEHLGSSDEKALDKALATFFDGSRLYYSFREFDDDWIAISAQLSKTCQAESRFEDASKVLITTMNAGPLGESQFYNHDPLSIIEYYLRQKDGDGGCLPEAIAAATHIFLVRLKEKPTMCFGEIEYIGRRLISCNIAIKQPSILHHIYWRVVSFSAQSSSFVSWAIRKFHAHKYFRNAIRYFLLNYSKMAPSIVCFYTTIDAVVDCVHELKGHKAKQVIGAIAQMESPGEEPLRTRWLIKALRACWDSSKDFAEVKELFEEILSLGFMRRISHPFNVYSSMVHIAVKANEDAVARSYCDMMILKYPEALQDVGLRGSMALASANAGNWDAVYDAFTEMQYLKEGREDEYADAFVPVLKVFAQTHSAAEVREFVSEYTGSLGVRMHRYAVTLVANKFAECRDTKGFMSWLAYCCKAGFALDSSVCNSILYNCAAKFQLSYPELLEIYSKIRRLGPSLIDGVTRRIMSQAASITGKDRKRLHTSLGAHSKAAIMNELWYRGRTINQRDVYEAMNQEIHSGRPSTAMRIYKQALRSGMPSCEYCLRLAIVATSRSPKNGTDRAMSLIRNAYEKGTNITSAVAEFIKFRLEQLQANATDLLLHMRNLISQFEAINIIVQPNVLTQMAIMVIQVGHFERGISLCTFAMDQHGFKNLAFSRQSIRASLSAYAALRDVNGTKKLCHDILESEYAADKSILSYLRSARRTVAKYKTLIGGEVVFGVLQDTIGKLVKRRAETRAGGATIAQETLRIMQEAAEDMQGSAEPEDVDRPRYGHRRRYSDPGPRPFPSGPLPVLF